MKQYVVDAFSAQVFSGNPAAICILEQWLPEALMINIAMENNLSETAFAVKGAEAYELRWFTPGGEIDMCGHATLACAYVLMRFYEQEARSLDFLTKSGLLTVRKAADWYEMDFPAYELAPAAVTDEITQAIGVRPGEVWLGRDLLCVLADEQQVLAAAPDLAKVKALDGLLLHLTARGRDYDCVSRTFAPKLNVPEDPVCGSGHCHIVPYWVNRLGRDKIAAYQASARSGVLQCRLAGDRVILGGQAALYAISDIFVDEI